MFAIAGSFETYGFFSADVEWQMRTFSLVVARLRCRGLDTDHEYADHPGQSDHPGQDPVPQTSNSTSVRIHASTIGGAPACGIVRNG